MSLYVGNEYPIVLSKQDPLIVRVNALSLVVGDSSFNAKVKMGSMYTGFYIYTSGLGEAVAKVEVSIDGYNNNYVPNNAYNTDAYNYITEQATIWMDNLQKSFTENTGQKNLVELLESVIRETERDGEVVHEVRIDSEVVADAINDTLTYTENSVTKSATEYLKNIYEKLDSISDGMTNISSSDTANFANIIAKSIEDGLTSLVTQMNAIKADVALLKTAIGSMDDSTSANSICGTVKNLKSNVGDISDSTTSTLCGVANTIKLTTDNTDTTTTTINTNLGTMSDTGTSTVCGVVKNVKSTVDTIHTTDVQTITNAISSSSSTGAVSDLSTVVSRIEGKVDTINSNTNSSSTLQSRVNTTNNDVTYLKTALTGTNGGAMSFDNTSGWTIKTELTLEDMIVDDSGTMKVKAFVS